MFNPKAGQIKCLARLCVDLKNELPGVSGLSKSNIYYCKKFYLLYNQEDKFFQQLDGIFQIPWGHHCLIMDKLNRSIAIAQANKSK